MQDPLTIDGYFERVVAESLPPLLAGFIALFSLFAVHRFLTLPEKMESVWLTVLLVMVLTGFLLSVKFWSRRLRFGSAHAAATALAVMLWAGHPDTFLPDYYGNIVFLCILACGLVLLNKVWALTTVLSICGLWFATLWSTESGPWRELGGLTSSVAVAALFFYLRKQLVFIQLDRLAAERAHNSLLTQTLESTRASREALARRVEEQSRQTARARQEIEAELHTRLLLQDQLRELGSGEPLGRLAANVAHDFNNLLIVLQSGVSDLREAEGLDHSEQEAAQDIEAALTGISEVTHQLLAFSGKQPLRRELLEVEPLLKDVVETLVGLLPERVELDWQVARPGLKILADKAQVQQALLNLSLNAYEAMPHGGHLHFLASEQRGWVSLQVVDTGGGIAADQLPRVKEPFYTTKGLYEGRGLGLAVVDGIAAQHSGRFRIESEPGVGTTATLEFPLIESRRAESHLLMLVEPEEASRRLYSRYLEHVGYRILEASSAEEARNLFTCAKVYPKALILSTSLADDDWQTLHSDLLSLAPELKSLVLVKPDDPPLEFANVVVLKEPFSLGEMKRLLGDLR